MPNLYRDESSDPKSNAQRNLCGRTHYVDDDTLRWHKSRVLLTTVADNGLLFAIVTSDALDMNNTKRGFRFVIFDVFGRVVERPKLGEAITTRKACERKLFEVLNGLDAKDITHKAIESARRYHTMEMDDLAKKVEAIK